MKLRSLLLMCTTVTAIALGGCQPDGADSVSGTITLSPERQARLGASDTLFITARPAGEAGGPPMAVLKIIGLKFPLAYTIGQEDVLMPGHFFTGKIQLQAVLRKSGMATLAVPGDVRGRASHAVQPGDKGIDIALDQPDEGSGAARGEVSASGAAAASGAMLPQGAGAP